jgi:PDZ domain-containing protein
MERAMYRVSASRRRLATWTLYSGSVALLATSLRVAEAQVTTRDSMARVEDRVYRIQARQLTDANYLRALRTAQTQLKIRLDSLQRAFEDMSVEAPDRNLRSREISALLSSLANLSALEEVARARDADRTARTVRARALLLGGDEGVLSGSFRPAERVLRRGWIGINVEAPHQQLVRGDSEFIRYFSYPEILSVEPNSPAERVGIARGDRLVAYDGADVHREINVTRLLQPSRRVTITVRRDGEDRDFSLVVVKAPQRLIIRRSLAAPEAPTPVATPEPMVALSLGGGFRLRTPNPPMLLDKTDGSSAIAGATLSEIRDEGLGHIFGVASGLLVTEVFSDPADASGLRGGDVIVGADGQDVTRLPQLRRIISAHNDDRSVELEVVRQKRTRTITLRW